MNNIIQMLLNQKMKQIPKGMINQLERQLKRVNPQAYQEFQQARKDNNPEEMLNKTINNFSPEQKKEWEQIMSQFGGINTK